MSMTSLTLVQDDHSGKLGYDEFKQLWGDMRAWKVICFYNLYTSPIWTKSTHKVTMILKYTATSDSA